MLLNEVISNSSVIYRWTNEIRLLNYISLELIPASWTHYIESEDRNIKGTSWSRDTHRWALDLPYCIVADLSKIPNKHYEINGHRTYLQTQAKTDTKGIYDPNAYKLEDETPNEIFIEGGMKFDKTTITKILVRSHKLGTFTKYSDISKKLKLLNIPSEGLKN